MQELITFITIGIIIWYVLAGLALLLSVVTLIYIIFNLVKTKKEQK